ncbi:uncharacterized protein LOC127685114 [Apodemus sylvaticus]|uniref:uncharacterized protein LOC127685114 n=1 Tax=Apodemus sylvaticus TaxID=10129 RepID=UPI002241AC7D|nr:uncharacterized protein LOC127685114 [Apodemus sylvaticus]
MVAAKKMKKSLESINSRPQLVMKSGKYVLGYKRTLMMIRQGKAKLAILANNCPALRKSEIEYYAMLPKTGVHHHSGDNIELGTASRKFYRVCTLAVTDPCDSDIIRSTPEHTGESAEKSASFQGKKSKKLNCFLQLHFSVCSEESVLTEGVLTSSPPALLDVAANGILAGTDAENSFPPIWRFQRLKKLTDDGAPVPDSVLSLLLLYYGQAIQLSLPRVAHIKVLLSSGV